MIVLDGATKRIILDSASVSAAQIWTAWVDWHVLNPQWPLAFQLIGGIDLGDGAFIPPYFFLTNGWRVRPMEATHVLKISGNLVVSGGGDPVVPTLGTFNVSVQYTVPVMAQGIATGGGSGASAADVWNFLLSGTAAGVKITQLLDLIEADEELTGTIARLRKRGTSTVLLEKQVTGGTITPVTLTEAP
jgi:hypothetical protein